MSRRLSADGRLVAALRISAQHIDRENPGTPAEVVRHMLAMQAQDFTAAKWAIGLRAGGTTDAAIETAIANREIVRSWPMRGTLHFVAPEDLGWMLSLGKERMIRGARTRLAELGLDESIFRRAEEIANQCLSGGRALSRKDLQARFEAAGIITTGQRGYSILWYLSLSGVLAFGPVLGKQHSFVLLDEWVTNPRNLAGDEALGEYARRYFVSHGPATARDFAWWSSLTLTDARRGIAVAQNTLDELVIDGTNYFLAVDAAPAANGVHLLPGFDEYVLGYQDRRPQLTDETAAYVIPGKNGIFMPTLVIDGEVVGTWRRKTVKSQAIVEVFPRKPLTKRTTAGLSAATKVLSKFLQMPVTLLRPE
jgi:Winged helix DNA-binding domain